MKKKWNFQGTDQEKMMWNFHGMGLGFWPWKFHNAYYNFVEFPDVYKASVTKANQSNKS